LTELKQAIGGLTPQERRDLMVWLAEQDRPVQAPGPAVSLRSAVIGTLLMLIAYVAAEGFIFHSGWYAKYLEPNSTAGQVEYNLFWLRRTGKPKVPDVLVVGDSRIAEGFSARVAMAADGGRVHFVNFGMPGAAPRVWYYVLRDMDKDRNRFSAIVLALDHYSDSDRADVPQNNPTDLSFLAGRLRFSDCWDFSRSFLKPDLRRSALTGCLIRGIAFRADVMSFLLDIPDRLARSKDWRNQGAGYIDGYGGKPETLAGLTFDPVSQSIHFPPGLKDWQINTARSTLTPYIVPQTGALTAYRRRWIGGILDLYKNSATQIVLFQLPNAPLPVPEPTGPPRFLRSVASRPRLNVLPQDTFRDLQHPDLFSDGLHLNQDGRKLFSEKLARMIAPLVTPH